MFYFNSLPDLLKNSILESVEIRDSLKFLQVNSNLRGYVLYRGALSGKIKEINVSSANEYLKNEMNEENEILVPTIKLELTAFSGTIVTFSSMQSLNSYKIDASYEKMFQKIRIIETIQVTLPMGSIPVSQKKAMKYSNFVDFLPNPKYLRKYSLNINNFSIFERIAARLNSKTEDTFRLILVKNTLRDEEEQILEKNLNEKFQSCKSIQLNIPIRPYLTQLSNENMELLVEYCEKWDHFTASIEPLLKFGISDRIGVAFCLKEGPSRWNSGFAAVQNFLSEKHEMNAFHEHSIEAMELLLKFFEGTVKNRLLLGKAVRRLESKACFRKTLLGRRGELFVMASVLDTNQLFVLLRCNRENIIDQP